MPHLLALGAREHTGIGRLLAGSVSHYCLSHSAVPVAAVPASREPEAAVEFDEVVVGLDDSPSGIAALSWAAAWARRSAVGCEPSMCWAGRWDTYPRTTPLPLSGT